MTKLARLKLASSEEEKTKAMAFEKPFETCFQKIHIGIEKEEEAALRSVIMVSYRRLSSPCKEK